MPTRLPSLRRPPIGFAHRGARAAAPENTLEAFRLALHLGATGLESDAWWTADGQVVLDHDGAVGGRFRRTPIRLIERGRLPSHIATLADLYQQCGVDYQLSLDLKDLDAISETIAVARDVGPVAESNLWLCHPDAEVVASWRSLSPHVHLVHSPRRLPRGGAERHAARLGALGIEAVNLHHSLWTGGLTTLFHRFGILAFGWDAQFERVLAELLDCGVDAVYSDHVDRLVAALAEAA